MSVSPEAINWKEYTSRYLTARRAIYVFPIRTEDFGEALTDFIKSSKKKLGNDSPFEGDYYEFRHVIDSILCNSGGDDKTLQVADCLDSLANLQEQGARAIGYSFTVLVRTSSSPEAAFSKWLEHFPAMKELSELQTLWFSPMILVLARALKNEGTSVPRCQRLCIFLFLVGFLVLIKMTATQQTAGHQDNTDDDSSDDMAYRLKN